jgi:hypothetical protein
MKDNFIITFFDKSKLIYNLKDKTFTVVGSFAHTCYLAKLKRRLSDKMFFRAIFSLSNDLKFNPVLNTILEIS